MFMMLIYNFNYFKKMLYHDVGHGLNNTIQAPWPTQALVSGKKKYLDTNYTFNNLVYINP